MLKNTLVRASGKISEKIQFGANFLRALSRLLSVRHIGYKAFDIKDKLINQSKTKLKNNYNNSNNNKRMNKPIKFGMCQF